VEGALLRGQATPPTSSDEANFDHKRVADLAKAVGFDSYVFPSLQEPARVIAHRLRPIYGARGRVWEGEDRVAIEDGTVIQFPTCQRSECAFSAPAAASGGLDIVRAVSRDLFGLFHAQRDWFAFELIGTASNRVEPTPQHQEDRMHAVIVAVTINDAEKATENLRNEIVPQVKQAPGFVAGYWTRFDGGKQGRGVMVFESEDAARAVAARLSDNPAEEVTLDSVDVGEVVESA
jgi:hypothetical protein